MTWTPVDLATIAGILDTLSVDSTDADAPDRLLDMLDAHTVPDPDTPSVDANAVRVLAGMLRMGVRRVLYPAIRRVDGVPAVPAPGPDARRLT